MRFYQQQHGFYCGVDSHASRQTQEEGKHQHSLMSMAGLLFASGIGENHR